MKKIIIGVLSIVIILLSLYSCEKDSIVLQNESSQLNTRSSVSLPDETLNDIGYIFSKLGNDEKFKTMILDAYNSSCIEEFLLVDLLKHIDSRSIIYHKLDSISLINPMLTIAYPSFAFHEDELFEKHLSSIDYTVILVDDPDEVKTLPAFDSNGQLINISAEFDESINYCVIKYSEFEIAVNVNTQKTLLGEDVVKELLDFKPMKVIGDFNIYSPSDLFNARLKSEGRYFEGNGGFDAYKRCNYPDDGGGDPPGGGGDPSGGGDNPCLELCDRDCIPKTKDELHKIKWSSKKALKKFESGWHLPRLELIAWYVIPKINDDFITSADLVQKDIRMHWKDMTGKWSPALGLEIVTWKNNYGDVWSVLWGERDYWNTVSEKYSIGFSAGFDVGGAEVEAQVKYDVTIKKKDKIIGASLIEYCDPAFGEGSEYKPYTYVDNDGTSGGFWFREHIRDN